jgi:hypothetical protein
MLDHGFSSAYSRFWRSYTLKLQKFITYSYNIQIIHILLRWNPIENGKKTHNFFIILTVLSSASS